jgi:hypothetical protein
MQSLLELAAQAAARALLHPTTEAMVQQLLLAQLHGMPAQLRRPVLLAACDLRLLTDPTLAATLCEGLTSLSLAGSSLLSGSRTALAVGSECGSSLTNLNLARVVQLQDADVVTLLQACSRLTSLTLAYCTKLTNAAVTAICSRAAGASAGSAFSGAAAAQPASCGGPLLQHLNLSACWRVDSVAQLAVLTSLR